jgi:hypothetical protein
MDLVWPRFSRVEVQLEDHRPAFRDKDSTFALLWFAFLFLLQCHCRLLLHPLSRVLSVSPASPLQATAMSCELSPMTRIREDAMTKITLLGKLKLQPYQCMWDGSCPV